MNYKQIYSDVFKIKKYNSSDSLSYAKALSFLNARENINLVSDIGSGRGNFLDKIKGYDFKIYSYDVVKNHSYDNYDNISYFDIDVTNIEELKKISEVDIIFCLDVLEHIEELYIDDILKIFSSKSKYCFFSIANHSDKKNGVELHLIRKNETFWNKIIEKYFDILNFEKAYDDRLMLYSLKGKK